jgi:hypothetical protein
MTSLRVDLNIPYKDQDIILVGKVIEKVRYYLLFKMIYRTYTQLLKIILSL